MTLPCELITRILLSQPPEVAHPLGAILAVRYGHPDLRDKLLSTSHTASIENACKNGKLELLEWWKAKAEVRPVNWSETTMDLASEYGQLTVLDWWKSSGLETEWSHKAID
ncbi:hypothetical protein HDV00_010903 [Rhizophlyctis rosea]|nr:hypothetical protein HDV00_010903 [Rhizophlyctis rosea]